MNRLVINKGPRAGEVIDLASGGVTLGADAEAANVPFDDCALASVHCRVAPVKGGGFGIQDLGSPSGTFLNETRVAAARLATGDRIRIGGVELVFESTDPNVSTPPPPSPRVGRCAGARRRACSRAGGSNGPRGAGLACGRARPGSLRNFARRI